MEIDKARANPAINVSWNKKKDEEIILAKRKFEEYIRQGWFAFVITSDNKKKLILNFDPALENIFFFPVSVGG